MKKIVLASFILLFNAHAFSQKFTVGMVMGASCTDVQGVDAVDGDVDFHRVGVVAGGFVNRSFTDRMSVQMELLYATKGSLQPADSTNDYLYYKLRLDYLEVPVLFKYKMHLLVNKEELDKLEIEGGISFGVLVNSWQENNNGEIPFDREFYSTDWQANIGLNYYFTESCSFDVRFAHSIVPIRPHPGGVTKGLDQGEYNTAFNFTLRLLFGN